jgi:hypothetical protein
VISHSGKLPDYQKDEQLSTYKFSIGERVKARYSDGEIIEGEVRDRSMWHSGPVYSIKPDALAYKQLFREHELTKVPQETESPYTIAIAAVDAEILKHNSVIADARKKVSDLIQTRATLVNLRASQ